MATNKSDLRGSQRHLLDLLDLPDFARRMNELIGVKGITLANDPCPVPGGQNSIEESDVDTYISRYRRGVWPNAETQLAGGNWWAPRGGSAPQMDLICCLTINGEDGLLLVEAKAHERELKWGGKPLAKNASKGTQENHDNIIRQIELANKGLNRTCGPGFNLSVSSHYQLANRLAYLWKLSSIGIPVVLMYLGFVGDTYFRNDYLRNDRHWERVMGGYLQGAVPQSFPEQPVGRPGPMLMVIRSYRVVRST